MILVAAGFDADEWAAWWPALEAAMPGERFIGAGAAGDGAPSSTLAALARAGVDPHDIDVALVANPPPGALQGLPALKLIQSLWAGVDRLLDDPTVPPAVPIARIVDPVMNAAMAETALWAVLGLQRGFFVCATQQREQRWQPPPLRRAEEFRVAVLGRGEMGGAVARALAAQGIHVTGWATRDGAAALAPLLAASDVVINLLPLTPATRDGFDALRFNQMRPGASLVNFARGAHVVEADLLAALDAGRLAHAVLDVFTIEPLPAGHPFWQHPRITVLPHIAAPTDPRSVAVIAAGNVQALRAGRMPVNMVDRRRGY